MEHTYRMPGLGLTRIIVGEATLVVGQPRRGYGERTIMLEDVEGFCVEPMPANQAMADFDGELVIAFRDGDRRRVYRLAAVVEDDAFRDVVAALGERRPDADLTRLPVADALARMRVSRFDGAWVAAIVVGVVALIVGVMLILRLRG